MNKICDRFCPRLGNRTCPTWRKLQYFFFTENLGYLDKIIQGLIFWTLVANHSRSQKCCLRILVVTPVLAERACVVLSMFFHSLSSSKYPFPDHYQLPYFQPISFSQRCCSGSSVRSFNASFPVIRMSFCKFLKSHISFCSDPFLRLQLTERGLILFDHLPFAKRSTRPGSQHALWSATPSACDLLGLYNEYLRWLILNLAIMLASGPESIGCDEFGRVCVGKSIVGWEVLCRSV